MDEEIKISEMLEAESIYEEDFIPIIQNGINKKISASKIGTGNGIPTGGMTGQVLTKSSNEDNEVTWKDPVETQVINNLNSSSTTSALSANQGRALNNKIALVKEEIVNKHTYSTEEQVIGTWIDGKPIYRKVIYSTINKSGTVSVQHGIANLGIVTNMYINFNRGDKQMINARISTDGYDIGLDTIYADYFDIAIPTIFGSSIKYIYAIMEYTKTTD